VGAIPDKLVEEGGFALVEALGVEGFFEVEQPVIEVVAEFVEEIALAMFFLFVPSA